MSGATRFGWSYLIVSREKVDGAPPTFRGDDGGLFDDEPQMLRELGATGWELITIRDQPLPDALAQVRYYFKRTRT